MKRPPLPFSSLSADQLILILGPIAVSIALVIGFTAGIVPLGLTGLLVLIAALNVGGDLVYALRSERAVRQGRVPLRNDMTGARAVVDAAFGSDGPPYRGSVNIGGEHWQAVSDRSLAAGSPVIVTGRRGLLLRVSPAADRPPA